MSINIFLSAKLSFYSGFDFFNKLCDSNEINIFTDQPKDALKADDFGLTDCIAPPYSLKLMENSVERVISKIKRAKKRKKSYH